MNDEKKYYFIFLIVFFICQFFIFFPQKTNAGRFSTLTGNFFKSSTAGNLAGTFINELINGALNEKKSTEDKLLYASGMIMEKAFEFNPYDKLGLLNMLTKDLNDTYFKKTKKSPFEEAKEKNTPEYQDYKKIIEQREAVLNEIEKETNAERLKTLNQRNARLALEQVVATKIINDKGAVPDPSIRDLAIFKAIEKVGGALISKGIDGIFKLSKYNNKLPNSVKEMLKKVAANNITKPIADKIVSGPKKQDTNQKEKPKETTDKPSDPEISNTQNPPSNTPAPSRSSAPSTPSTPQSTSSPSTPTSSNEGGGSPNIPSPQSPTPSGGGQIESSPSPTQNPNDSPFNSIKNITPTTPSNFDKATAAETSKPKISSTTQAKDEKPEFWRRETPPPAPTPSEPTETATKSPPNSVPEKQLPPNPASSGSNEEIIQPPTGPTVEQGFLGTAEELLSWFNPEGSDEQAISPDKQPKAQNTDSSYETQQPKQNGGSSESSNGTSD